MKHRYSHPHGVNVVNDAGGDWLWFQRLLGRHSLVPSTWLWLDAVDSPAMVTRVARCALTGMGLPPETWRNKTRESQGSFSPFSESPIMVKESL